MNREYDPTAANVSTVDPREILYINFPEHFTFVKVSRCGDSFSSLLPDIQNAVISIARLFY